MEIEAFILAFNEAETIHLTIKHYKQFCDRITIFDNFSTDDTREIAESLGCIVKPFGIAGVLDDKEYLKVKNHCWKGSDADWVIVCDADEILCDSRLDFNLRYTLESVKNDTIFTTKGWNIFSNDVPHETWSEITTGIPDSRYSKQIIFNPKEIKEIGYVYGCHENKPEGNVKYYYESLNLLHYKHIGGAKRVADRHALYAERLSDWNKRYKCGFQYQEPREQTIKYFNECLKKSVPFSQAGF
jgi:glycosyltransferase involved in cell wall biosynthesis